MGTGIAQKCKERNRAGAAEWEVGIGLEQQFWRRVGLEQRCGEKGRAATTAWEGGLEQEEQCGKGDRAGAAVPKEGLDWCNSAVRRVRLQQQRRKEG